MFNRAIGNRGAEAMLGTPIHNVSKMPVPGLVTIRRKEGAVIGQGFRVGDNLITAAHVWALATNEPEVIFLNHEGKGASGDPRAFAVEAFGAMDFIVLTPPNNFFAVLGISTMRLSLRTTTQLHTIYWRSDVGPVMSRGTIQPIWAESEERLHSISTLPGSSGAPVLNQQGNVVGMHVGNAVLETMTKNLLIEAATIAVVMGLPTSNRKGESTLSEDSRKVREVNDDVEVDTSNVMWRRGKKIHMGKHTEKELLWRQTDYSLTEDEKREAIAQQLQAARDELANTQLGQLRIRGPAATSNYSSAQMAFLNQGGSWADVQGEAAPRRPATSNKSNPSPMSKEDRELADPSQSDRDDMPLDFYPAPKPGGGNLATCSTQNPSLLNVMKPPQGQWVSRVQLEAWKQLEAKTASSSNASQTAGLATTGTTITKPLGMPSVDTSKKPTAGESNSCGKSQKSQIAPSALSSDETTPTGTSPTPTKAEPTKATAENPSKTLPGGTQPSSNAAPTKAAAEKPSKSTQRRQRRSASKKKTSSSAESSNPTVPPAA
nr:MAG: hypothetical protein 1 [Sobelivirales sp.]